MLYTMLLTDIAMIRDGIARSGRGAGARRGDWRLHIVESGNVSDDGWLDLDGLREDGFARNIRTERHLLRPLDLLLTARAETPRIALIPTDISRSVAGATLLVVRPHRPETGISYWLWYYLTSAYGRAQLSRHRTRGGSLTWLSRRRLAELQVPVPAATEVAAMVRLVDAAEAAYTASAEAARLRREVLRDALVGDIVRRMAPNT